MNTSISEPVTVYVGEGLKRYAFGDGHPFGPDRHDRFWNEAVRRGLDKQVLIRDPVLCEEKDLRRFHDDAYIDFLKMSSIHGTGYLDSGDTPAFVGIYEAASYVTGSGLDAMHRIMSGELRRVFIPIAGLHHANRSSAAGFCAVSDIGVIIETLREQYEVSRVLYVDIDAHHGDGVFYSYESDPQIIIGDIHEDGRYLYPGTGHASETGKGEAQAMAFYLENTSS